MRRLQMLALGALLLGASLPVVFLHAMPDTESSGAAVEGECMDPTHDHSHSHDHGHAHATPAAAASHDHGHSHGHAHAPSHGHSTWVDAAAHAPRFDLHAFGVGRVWSMAMGASLLVSCASLVCLALLPLMGARPSPTVVKFLSGFAVGAMLGDAFIHQLPSAFAAAPAHAHSHALSMWESAWDAVAQQAVGLSCLAGLGVFFLVEKIILHFGDSGHGHSHGAAPHAHTDTKTGTVHTAGWLNLFADAVHNFTDGMAIGAAFGSGGPVPGWAKTMFILAHELPQEVGDYGILLSAGFNSWQALGFNFLSALVALAGTAFALAVGTGSGAGSGLVEGFTAGGFIYISVAGVIPMMHTQRNDSVLLQLLSMVGGVVVCVAIHANGGCDGHP